MSNNEKHLIRHWKGSRESYNYLREKNVLDPWTEYIVIDTINSGQTNSAVTYTHYVGDNQVYDNCDGVYTVIGIRETEPLDNIKPYDRYLVGTDATGYEIYEYQPIKTDEGEPALIPEIIKYDWKKGGVRIKEKGLKCYVYLDEPGRGGKLITYDEVDCGEWP